MRKITLLLTLLIAAASVFANSAHRELYIEQYKHLAISEMHRTGIPASIKLAQAILESNAGQSTLAREANNHFGIKCGSYWNGKTFFRKDDDRNKRGKLVKSCFRAFKDPVDSFIEHSDFLSVQNRNRYDFLFNYSSSDYTNWAYGLKKAGYATYKAYPQLLIKLIEEFQLYKYDNPGGLEEVVIVSKPNNPTYQKPSVTNTAPVVKQKRNQPNIFSSGSAGEISMEAFKTKVVTSKVNKVTITYATDGDDLRDISARSGISTKKLIKFNDGINTSNQRLESGAKIFLSKKKTSFKGNKKFHFVKAEDSMVSIAQEYGIQKSALFGMNRMSLGTEPAIGEKIRLKGKMANGKNIKTRMLRVEQPKVVLTSGNFNESTILEKEEKTNPIIPLANEVIVAEKENTSESQQSIDTQPSNNEQVVIQWETSKVESAVVETLKYIVKKGDTLWSIARRYNSDVQTIRSFNSLSNNTIHIGQELMIR